MLKVFISYAREDGEAALTLYKDLRQYGIDAWIDTEDLLPGQQWATVIRHTLRQSTHVIVMLSARSVSKRGFVQREINFALDILDEIPPGEIFVIPARLDDVEPPHQRLQDIHWVDLFPSYEQGLRRLLRSLVGSRVEPLPQTPTPPPPPLPVDYQRGIRRLIRKLLEDASREGLKGDHHFVITFATNAPGVIVPGFVREKYPSLMKVILQYQFSDLEADSDQFSVTLSFNHKEENITIPYEAIVEFADPSEDLVLKLEPFG